MKKLLLILLAAIPSLVNGQAILRVNNTPGINAPYSDIATAVAAAGVNDIIMVEGSITTYGNVTITKKVRIIGPGYFLSENTGLQSNLNAAKFGTIQLNTGASNSVIQGLQIENLWIGGTIDNFSLIGNYISTDILLANGSGTNLLFQSNYIFQFRGDFQSPDYYGVLITNNYIGYRLGTSVNGSYTVSNNVIGLTVASDFRNAEIKNNVFSGGTGTITLSANSTFKNNVSTGITVAGADPINIFNTSSSSLFIGLTGNTTDTQWKLKAGSPAIGAGEGGIDCGIYSGASPYRPSGITAGQPTIFNFTAPATVTQNGTLNVKVSAKVN